MKILDNLKDKGQSGVNRVAQVSKGQPRKVKVWAITAGSAVAGGLAVTVLTLVAPPVGLAIGAVAGGALGWKFVHRADSEEGAAATTDAAASEPTASESVASAVTADAAPAI